MAVSMATLNDELEQLTAERTALRAKHPGAVMPDEARARDAEIADRVQRLTVLIEQEQQRQRDALFAETSRYMDDPNYRIPRAVNADDAGRRTLQQAGWDIRGGMVFRQTSRGEMAYMAEEVLFGPVPNDDPVAAEHYREVRASFQPEYRAAFVRYIKARGQLALLTPAEQNALSEGTASEGGFTVPADIQAELLVRRADASVMRRVSTVRQTTRDRMQFMAVVPNASNGSIYTSGFVGGLVGERAVNTDAGPTFQMFEIGIKDFEAYTRLSNNLIADSGSDMLAFLASDGGENLGLVEDYYFINGDGTGLQPLGLLNTGLTTASVEGTTTDHISSTTADAGSIPKLIELSYLVPAQYAERGSWLMARATKGKIHGLVDGENRPWWQAAAQAGGVAGAPAPLLEMPVNQSPFMPVGGTNGNKVLVVGDLSAYVIVERQAISVVVDPINLVGSKETQIFIRSRAGGGLWNTDALRVGIV